MRRTFCGRCLHDGLATGGLASPAITRGCPEHRTMVVRAWSVSFDICASDSRDPDKGDWRRDSIGHYVCRANDCKPRGTADEARMQLAIVEHACRSFVVKQMRAWKHCLYVRPSRMPKDKDTVMGVEPRSQPQDQGNRPSPCRVHVDGNGKSRHVEGVNSSTICSTNCRAIR